MCRGIQSGLEEVYAAGDCQTAGYGFMEGICRRLGCGLRGRFAARQRLCFVGQCRWIGCGFGGGMFVSRDMVWFWTQMYMYRGIGYGLIVNRASFL